MTNQQNGQGEKQASDNKEMPGCGNKEAVTVPTPHPDTAKEPEKMGQEKETEASKTTKETPSGSK